MEMLPDSPTSPCGRAGRGAGAVASLTETLWAAARPEDLLDVNVEIERLRSLVAAVQARVAVGGRGHRGRQDARVGVAG